MNDLLLFFSNLRWQDIIDISFISYILFRFYVLFRGTNTFRVLAGIICLWFFQRIAFSIGLILTSLAIQGITAVGALIIIVIFRHEIRSVFQTKNLRTILWGFPRRNQITHFEIIEEAVIKLTENSLGAILVFPGKEDLTEFVQGGIALNGLLSREIIESIFWKDNPVHDGAIIIEGDRIVDVGAILPLTHQQDLPSKYGTRHRAALGLAEQTDALVIVVSEERRSVAAVKGSQIEPLHERENLTRVLRDHSGEGAEENSGRKEKIEFSAAALISFITISMIWFSFTSGRDMLTTLDVPVNYINRSPEMEIVDVSLNSIRLHLSGAGALLKSIGPEHLQVKADLGKGIVGKNTVFIDSEDIVLPPGIKLDKIDPSNIEITLDKIIKKEMPVQVNWTGKLDDRLILVEIKTEPSKVAVSGSMLRLNKLATIYTREVSLNNIRRSGKKTVELLVDETLTVEPDSDISVQVSFVVEKRDM